MFLWYFWLLWMYLNGTNTHVHAVGHLLPQFLFLLNTHLHTNTESVCLEFVFVAVCGDWKSGGLRLCVYVCVCHAEGDPSCCSVSLVINGKHSIGRSVFLAIDGAMSHLAEAASQVTSCRKTGEGNPDRAQSEWTLTFVLTAAYYSMFR